MAVLAPTALAGMVRFSVQVALAVENVQDAAIWAPDPNPGLWGTSVWNASEPYWNDVTTRAISVNTSRGRDRWEQRFRTGSAQNLLDNQDGVLSLSTGQLGTLPLRPGRWWRLLGEVVGATPAIPLFTGQIDTMSDRYGAGAGSISSLWSLLDWFSRWAIDDPPALESPVGGGELTSERVTRILDLIGTPDYLRDIEPGTNTMQSSDLAQNRLEEMAAAADAEGGALFIAGDGKATFRAGDWLETNPRSLTPQLYAGAPGDHVQVTGATTDWSQTRVRNDIRLARRGGSEYRVTDAQSQTLYGPRTYQRYDLENDSDAAVEALAQKYLAAFRWDRTQLETVTLYPLDHEGATEMMELLLGDRVRLRVSTIPGWNYTGEYYVNRISHNVDAEDWSVTLRIDDVNLAPPLSVKAFTAGFDEGFQ